MSAWFPSWAQLIEVFDKIGKQLDRGKQIDVIYLDMSKAFDKVSHKRLLLRLREFGFGGNILNWFRSYLQDRRQQTTILSVTSLPSQVTSEVPQGSILGPVLFLLYENDLPFSVKNSSIATYADDTKIFKEIHNIGDAASLQEDPSNFESSSSDVGLHLNTSKCKALRVTRKHRQIKYPYTLQDSMLENVENERDLGVWISNNLTWRKQVLEQCSKANKMLGFIKRSTRTTKNCKARRTLYSDTCSIANGICYTSLVSANHRPHCSLRMRTKTCFQIHFRSHLSFVKAATPKGLLTWSFYL